VSFGQSPSFIGLERRDTYGHLKCRTNGSPCSSKSVSIMRMPANLASSGIKDQRRLLWLSRQFIVYQHKIASNTSAMGNWMPVA
jgi:hypothetical protein